uniref:Transmembrane protein n=1 Tax=Panagrellus redivivus TaxID=6233 RepID=A0A7E4W0I6_PANRE
MIRAVALAVLFVAFAVVTAVLEDAWTDPVIRVLRSAEAPTNDFIDINVTISTNETVSVVQEASAACHIYTPLAAFIAAIVSFLL